MQIAIAVKDTVNTLAGTFIVDKRSALEYPPPSSVLQTSGNQPCSIALLMMNRAIVSDIHGTTRDTIEDTTEIGGVIFRFIDTAGLRDTATQSRQWA